MNRIEPDFIRSHIARYTGGAAGSKQDPDVKYIKPEICKQRQNPGYLINVRQKSRSSRFNRITVLLFIFFIPAGILADPPSFNVLKYGAKKDGTTLSTRSIQETIDACYASGGGTVYFPAGEYLSGTIYLKSNVGLFFDAGAILRGSTELSDYPLTISKVRSYTDNYTNKSLIYAEDLENVSISGKGLIDGNGACFKVENIDNDDGLRKQEDFAFYKSRPYLIRMINCKRVTVQDIKLMNSPMWVQHYLLCEDLVIDGITVNSKVNHNNDGIDIDGCERVRISNCNIISGDDAIVLKSTTGNSCKNVTITNCVLSSDCNAFKLGTETNGGFQDISFSNCTITDTRLAGITLQIVDGGNLERVSVSNITMNNVGSAIFIRLGNRARPYKENMPKPGMGKLSGVLIDNITASNIGITGCSIAGLPGYPVDDIRLNNISLKYNGGPTDFSEEYEIPELPDAYPEHNMFGVLPAYGFYCRHCRNIKFSNMEILFERSESRPAMIYEDIQDLEFHGIRVKAGIKNSAIVFRNVKNAFIRSCTAIPQTEVFLKLEGSDSEQISIQGNDLSGALKPILIKNTSVVNFEDSRAKNNTGNSDARLINCDFSFIDDRMIRIDKPAEVRKKRIEIINAIWGSDQLPDRADVVVTECIRNPLSPDPVISQVDKFEIPLNATAEVNGMPLKDLAYFFIPVGRNNRLILVNPGHSCTLIDRPETNYRVESTIKGLLRKGFDVLAVYMPHVSDTICDLDHCRIINTSLGQGDHTATYGLRFFLEPEIVSLNYLLGRTDYKDVSMVGLSGGGWTTNLLAAIDERIKYSFSIAGSMPLYYRSGGSIGDVEQYLPEMYRDIAGYPELYVLGAYGKERKQVQILNRKDDCCFGQKQHDPGRDYDKDLQTFENTVKEKLKSLRSDNHYYLVIDEYAENHQISRFALENVILYELMK